MLATSEQLSATSDGAAPAVQPRPQRDRLDAVARNSRARATNDPSYVPGLNRCLPTARRVRDLIVAYLAKLGGPEAVDHATMAAVKRAAELVAACELARARALNGRKVDLAALSRLEGTADRAVRALRLDKPRAAPVPTLAEYLRDKAAAASAPPASGATVPGAPAPQPRRRASGLANAPAGHRG
jgi:hypothetical protein